jgi:uncharacterized phosphosugar-binding protein
MVDGMYERYLDVIDRLLREARDANSRTIPAAAEIIAQTVAGDGIVRVFGTGHSELIGREIFDRAGGLAAVDVITDLSHGQTENVPGYAASLLHEDQLRPPDCLLVASTSGRNVAPVEMALIARDRGLPVIAVTSLEFSRGVASRHASSLRLIDLADVVLDTRAPLGDAAISLGSELPHVGPVSTVIGAALVNSVLVEAITLLARDGATPPIFLSSNVDGSEAHNAALNDRYRGRVRALM